MADLCPALGHDGTDVVAGAAESTEEFPALDHIDCVASPSRPGT